MKKLCSRSAIQAIGLLALGVVLSVAPRVHPADHGDAPIAGNNQSTISPTSMHFSIRTTTPG